MSAERQASISLRISKGCQSSISRRGTRGSISPLLVLAALLLLGAVVLVVVLAQRKGVEPEKFVPPEVAPGAYQRIVSLTPSVTEILFALGAEDRVAGVTSACNYPDATRAITKVGDFIKPNFEAVLALKPDLIIMAATGTELRKSYDNFAALGLNVLVVWNNTIQETLDAIDAIGRVLQAEDRAQALIADLEAVLDRYATLRGSRASKKVLWVVGHRPLIAVGPGTFQAEILEAAGGINVIPSEESSWPAINEEFVLQANPEVIIDSAMGGEIKPTEEAPLGPWARYASVRAVREGQVRFIFHDALYRPGPRMEEALEFLASGIHHDSVEAKE